MITTGNVGLGGEVNTASNLGVVTYGLYKNKLGVDLQFKSLTATSSKISLRSNSDDVGIDLVEGNIIHNNLGGKNDGDYKHLTATEKTNTDDAVTKRHTQNTDTKLAEGTANEVTAANVKDAVDKKHTQGTDQGLDTGGANAVVVADVKDAVTKKHSHSNIISLDLVSGTNTGDETTITLGSKINGASEKTTPIDADMVGLMDSNASNILKKLSWTNIKATLKTYFDSLYTLANLGGVPTSRQVNGHALSSDVTVSKSDVGLSSVTNDAQLKRSASDFTTFTEKTTPVNGDIVLIEDSADSNNKKKLQIGNLSTKYADYYYAESLGESNTTSSYATFVNKLTYSLTPIAGTYILEWNYEITNSAAGNDNWIRIWNGTDIYSQARINSDVTYANSGWRVGSGFVRLTLTAIAMNFYIDFCRQAAGTVYIKNVKIMLRRVS
jgi:hypothetical protein